MAILKENGTPINELFFHWRMWLLGLLPNSGTYLDQPARFVEAMTLLDRLWVEYRTEKEREEERKINRIADEQRALVERRKP